MPDDADKISITKRSIFKRSFADQAICFRRIPIVQPLAPVIAARSGDSTLKPNMSQQDADSEAAKAEKQAKADEKNKTPKPTT